MAIDGNDRQIAQNPVQPNDSCHSHLHDQVYSEDRTAGRTGNRVKADCVTVNGDIYLGDNPNGGQVTRQAEHHATCRTERHTTPEQYHERLSPGAQQYGDSYCGNPDRLAQVIAENQRLEQRVARLEQQASHGGRQGYEQPCPPGQDGRYQQQSYNGYDQSQGYDRYPPPNVYARPVGYEGYEPYRERPHFNPIGALLGGLVGRGIGGHGAGGVFGAVIGAGIGSQIGEGNGYYNRPPAYSYGRPDYGYDNYSNQNPGYYNNPNQYAYHRPYESPYQIQQQQYQQYLRQQEMQRERMAYQMQQSSSWNGGQNSYTRPYYSQGQYQYDNQYQYN